MNSKERFSRAEVMAIPAPAYTKTWHPVPHREVITSLEQVVTGRGVGIMNETYSVTNKGNNLFGAWTLDIGVGGKQIQMGFRNSISKDFAVGICAGTWVMVCSNMQFRGDFIEFRKHTSGLEIVDLLTIGTRAFDKVVTDGQRLIEWQDQLHDYPISGDRFKCLTFDAMKEGVFGANHFNAFLSSYAEEVELTKEGTLYEFHGAATRMIRNINLFSINDRTRSLDNMLDKAVIDINMNS
jgi:hypothetical protein